MKKLLLRQTLRNYIRLQRRTLSPHQQAMSAHLVVDRVMNDPRIHTARTIAVFLSFDGELNTQPLITALWTANKQVYLPVLHPFIHGHVLFMRYTDSTPLVLNRLRIHEPQFNITTILPLVDLDILFVPLVVFDIHGQRLGMGGGFYDRILQSWQPEMNFYPIGLAHDCQQITIPLPVEQWDIGLPEIITPSHHWQWDNNRVKNS